MSQTMSATRTTHGAYIPGEWTILDENGATAVSFTSFIDVEFRHEGQALSYPIEEGGFTNYNKTDKPVGINVTLAAQGTDSDYEYILARLGEYKKKAVKLAVSAPFAFYESMTLQSFSNPHSRENNSGMLTVTLNLVEVREVKTQVTTGAITKPKNPTSADKVNTGRVRADDLEKLRTWGL